jgi:parallel beta-helix repeat protein
VIIQNPGGTPKGIVVLDDADGFTLKNITIQGFGERALDMTNVDGFLLSHVNVINNGEFGLFAEYCKNGIIEHCEGSGHAETGIFVGQSTNVNILQNKMHGNVIGLEVENSSTIVLDKNHSYDNAVGIMCLLVPGRMVTQSSGITITKNQVRENNHINFSAPPEQESVLPSGLGILVLGTDNTIIRDNHVTDNKFAGIATLSSLIIGQLAGIPEAYFASIEPNPDYLRVISNQVKNNGYAPPSGLPLPGADLLWDGKGTYNCWSKNLFTISFPSTLPACQ